MFPAVRAAAIMSAVAVVGGCQFLGGDTTYTLYRNSVVDPAMRIHVATFDAAEKEAYNIDNCDTAKGLFQRQSGVSVRFWCEKGRYKKDPSLSPKTRERLPPAHWVDSTDTPRIPSLRSSLCGRATFRRRTQC